MSSATVHAEITKAGQQRAYGPTCYEATLTFARQYLTTGEWSPRWVDSDQAKAAFRLLVQDGWKDEREPAEWHELTLEACERLAPTSGRSGAGRVAADHSDRWLVRVCRPYDD